MNRQQCEVEWIEVLRDECVIVPHVVIWETGWALPILVFYLQNIYIMNVNIFKLDFHIHWIEFRIPGCWIVKTDQPGWHCCKGELTRAGLRFEKAVSRTWAQFPMKINSWWRETWGRRTCTSRWQEGSSRWREPIGGCRTWCCRSAEAALCTSAPHTWTNRAQISGDYQRSKLKDLTVSQCNICWFQFKLHLACRAPAPWPTNPRILSSLSKNQGWQRFRCRNQVKSSWPVFTCC